MDSVKPLEIVFKHVGGLNIAMDVYVPESATPESPAPVVLWWHGGGLLQGTRKAPSSHQLRSPSSHNICFISADYRLAPQVKFPAILSDCKAAIDFLFTPEFASATGNRVDPNKLILSGSSAGGWLSLLCGTGIGFKASGLDPPGKGRVKGIAALYPITDLLDPFWTTKQYPVSYFKRVIDKEELGSFLDHKGEIMTSSALDSPRNAFYHYMIQEGILADLLLAGESIKPSAYSIAATLKSGEFALPPTYIVHGDIDDKVTVRQARDVVAAAGPDAGVQYDELEGVDHLFDRDPSCNMENMYIFIHRVFGNL
ncbi:Alpha/Beta hydrolase protein [Desarmillaria tabescens]|uniref:Alpha/Beta hydrolase protein n=1 Tax=Armillaria tabescens TaxID=1929756 RepID=A0AA39T423_ARMTA|nr:Alpha/Beta hydrolase protein [Desarmillaria tabescens]KAK0463106.1 Alpha/Beta hydrolase protein [Desarmillaria tabescens]